MKVTSATSSEEGAVDLPGAEARSQAPDVLRVERMWSHFNKIVKMFYFYNLRTFGGYEMNCQRNGDNIRPGMRGRQSWSLKQNNVCFRQNWRCFCLVRGKTMFDYLMLFSSTTTDLSRKRGREQILLSEKDSNKTWQSIHIYIRNRHRRHSFFSLLKIQNTNTQRQIYKYINTKIHKLNNKHTK